MKNKLVKFSFFLFPVLLILSAALYITEWNFIPYTYTVSGISTAIFILSVLYKGNNLRLKRLNVQLVLSSLFITGSSYFMFKKTNEWAVLLLIAILLFSYAMYIRDRELNKGNDKNDQENVQGKNYKPSESEDKINL